MTDPSPQSNSNRHADAGLDQFGGGVSIDPPRVKKGRKLVTTTPDGTRHVGNLGEAADRPNPVFLTSRHSEDHRIRYLEKDNGGSYAISADVVESLRLEGVTRVFVVEYDTSTVYEWDSGAFIDGEMVPEKFLQTDGDPQRYAARDSAKHVWNDHGPDDFYRPRGEATDE